MFSVFLSSYRNTRESLGELEKAVQTLACGSCSHSISRSPKLPLMFLLLTTKFSPILIGLNWSRNAIVFNRGETLSAQSARPRKTPGWIVLVREKFSVNKRADKKINKLNCIKWVLFIFRFKFYIWLSRLSSKKIESNSIWFLNWRAKEKLVVNNKDNKVFMSRNYPSDSCPLEI